MANGEWEIGNGERWVAKGEFRMKNCQLGKFPSITFYVTRFLDAVSAGPRRSKTVIVFQGWYTVFVLNIIVVSLEYIISEWAFYTDAKKLNLFQKLYSSCNTVMIRGINITKRNWDSGTQLTYC